MTQCVLDAWLDIGGKMDVPGKGFGAVLSELKGVEQNL